MIPEDSPLRDQATRVLVVDDAPDVRRLTEKLLSRCGYEALGAGGGEEAIRLCSAGSSPVDLVLLDLNMPGLSGPETFVALRGENPDLPVILYSGDDVDPDGFAAQHGERPQGVLRKPFGIEQLAAAVENVIKHPA